MNLQDVDLRLIRVFLTIVERGGFSAAQIDLNVAQSTISNHMTSLEKRLGCTLCKRGPTGFRLTDEGHRVYAAAKRLIQSIETFQADCEEVRRNLAGQLRLGVVDNTITDENSPISRAVGQFMRRKNDVQIHFTIDSPRKLQLDLLNGDLDLIICGHSQRLPNLYYTVLYQESHSFYCGTTHPLFSFEGDISIDIIAKYRLIARQYLAMQDMEKFGEVVPAAIVNNMESELTLILSGQFIGFLPDHFARSWVVTGALKVIGGKELTYATPIHRIARANQAPNVLLNTFIEDLSACVPTATRTLVRF